MKKLLATLALLATIAPAAGAHTQCRVNLPFGGWTEGCPFHNHPTFHSVPKPRNRYHRFTVKNSDYRKTVAYHIAGKRYVLYPGQSRRHSVLGTRARVTVDRVWNINSTYDTYYREFDPRYKNVELYRDGNILRVYVGNK